jgi:hypothetical protein
MAVLPRDEWRAKLDDAESIGYSKGRTDTLNDVKPLVELLESILQITNEEHFIRGADGKLQQIKSVASLAIAKLCEGIDA